MMLSDVCLSDVCLTSDVCLASVAYIRWAGGMCGRPAG